MIIHFSLSSASLCDLAVINFFPIHFCACSIIYLCNIVLFYFILLIFLVNQVGVDNMCILVHAVKRQSLELAIEEKISNALVEVGPSITLASLSEILAFAVGSFIPMPACRVFSMFAGQLIFSLQIEFMLDFCLRLMFFGLLLVGCIFWW